MWKNKAMTMRTFLFSLLLILGLICYTNAAESSEADYDGLVRGNELVDEGLVPVYDMTNYFLEDIVQTKDLNYMAENGVDFSDFDSILDSFENDYKEWANYAIGYAVCAVIGVLLLVFVPLVGFCLCCCRTCCGTCGGKVDPRETSNSGCKRHCCGFFLFVVITIVFLGSLAMFFTAVRIHDELYSDEDVFHSIADGMETMGDYVNTTLDELEVGTLGVYNKTVDNIFDKLDNVVTDSYNTLDEAAGISRNMDPLLVFTGQMLTLSNTLTDVQTNATELQTKVANLETNFDNLKADILTELQKCIGDTDCDGMINRVTDTAVQVDYTNITTGYVEVTTALELAIQANLNGLLDDGYKNFTSIIDDVNSTVITEIESAREAADDVASTIGGELDNVREDIGSIEFDEIVDDFRNWDSIEDPAFYAFVSLSSVAAVVVFIVFLTYLGLLFSCCPRAKKEADYCCTRKMGATCLLAGVGFTFIFMWIFILILIPTFLVGGLTHTELCRHLVHLDQTPISGIIDDLVNASIGEGAGFTINITGIYTGCKNNETFYTALDAETTFGFNLTELLDVSQIQDMIDQISDLDIPIGNITIINNQTQNALNLIADPLSEAATDTETYLDELAKEVTTENLKELADELKALGINVSLPNLEVLAHNLSTLYNDTVISIDEHKTEVGMMLVDSQDELKTNISGISKNLLAGQTKTNNDGQAIIQGVIDDTSGVVMGFIDGAVSDIDGNVRNEIGRCAPVYGAVATIVDAGCVELLYALNGYWFALGWSVFFLLVSVILSFKLSTVYRKTLDYGAELPQQRRGGRPPKNQGHRNNAVGDSAVLIMRNDSHEMMPVTNPVYTTEATKFPRPQLKANVVYYQEASPFVGKPPSYSETQYKKK